MFGHPAEMRPAVYATNTVGSSNMTLREVTKTRSRLPNGEAGFKLMYTALTNISERRTMPKDWSGAITDSLFRSEGECRRAASTQTHLHRILRTSDQSCYEA